MCTSTVNDVYVWIPMKRLESKILEVAVGELDHAGEVRWVQRWLGYYVGLSRFTGTGTVSLRWVATELSRTGFRLQRRWRRYP